MKVNFEIIEDDILNQAEWADAIVNCANNSLLHGGGICGTIFEAAGKGLEEECKKFGGRDVAECVVTNGYNIPAKIIHAVGSRYNWNREDNKEILERTYKNVIKIAEENKLEKIAFPLISSGIYSYPLRVASEVAVNFLKKLQSDVVKEVRLVLYSRVYYLACKEHIEGND